MMSKVEHKSEIGTFLEEISPYLGAHFYNSEARVETEMQTVSFVVW